jgi:hypothetical protein
MSATTRPAIPTFVKRRNGFVACCDTVLLVVRRPVGESCGQGNNAK